jgi:hypothetical protein
MGVGAIELVEKDTGDTSLLAEVGIGGEGIFVRNGRLCYYFGLSIS